MSEVELDTRQQQAILLCTDMTKRLVAITGQAGTGKTTIIQQTAEMLMNHKGLSVAVAAPTGKAARRIREITGLPAVTLHKLLEYPRPDEVDEETGRPLQVGYPKRNRLNPLAQRVVIVDEYAMVNHELHNNLMAAIPSGGVVRVFGDLNQLPPIEEYKIKTDKRSPFKKLLQEQPSVTLDQVYRQAEGSDVLAAATKVRNGLIPRAAPDFRLKVGGSPIPVLTNIVMEAEDEDRSFRSIERQVITPQNTGGLGTTRLNQLLRSLLNPNPIAEVELPRKQWDKGGPLVVGVGDKVVCHDNTYDLRSFEDRYAEWIDGSKPILHSFIPTPDTHMMLNGETGVIIEIELDGAIQVDFGDRVVRVPPLIYEYWAKRDQIIEVDNRKVLGLAYALTTHKCQGSEYKEVIYIINRSMSYMLGRENFYTAITRARSVAHVVADQVGLTRSVNKHVP